VNKLLFAIATMLSLSLFSLFSFLHSHPFQEQHLGFSSLAWKEIILINLLGFCKKTSTIETSVTRHQCTFANGKKKLTTLNKNNRFS
jgi:hypothetical protein